MKKKVSKKHPSKLAVHFSSKKGDHETPDWLYDFLDKRFKFKCDVAASKKNAKHKRFITEKENALADGVQWAKGWNFCNPPYGRGVLHWCNKAYQQSKLDRYTVMLLPARTDTFWFHNLVVPQASKVVFIKSRLTFKGNPAPAPFPSMLVVWGLRDGRLEIKTLGKR